MSEHVDNLRIHARSGWSKEKERDLFAAADHLETLEAVCNAAVGHNCNKDFTTVQADNPVKCDICDAIKQMELTTDQRAGESSGRPDDRRTPRLPGQRAPLAPVPESERGDVGLEQ